MGRLKRSSQALGLVGALGLLSGCGRMAGLVPAEPSAPSPGPIEASTVTAAPPPSAPASPVAPAPDPFREAVNRATSAVAIGQSAQSPSDWTLAAGRWQQAIALMQQVPNTSTNYAQAQTKAKEYQTHLAAAQQRAAGKPVAAAPATAPAAPHGLVAQIPIQERRGGTPVVSVTLKGQRGSQAFPMLFDTGATGTLITQAMADAIGVVVVGETRVTIADGSVVTLPIGYVDGLQVGTLRKTSMMVAIGGDAGLLGQDVYGEYAIAMGSQVINLHE